MTVALARRRVRMLLWLLACVPFPAPAQLGGPLPPDAQSVLAGANCAGHLDHGVLRQFKIAFDYAAGALFLEKNANFGLSDVHDRTGVWIERGARGFEVVDVVAGGPAEAAGVRAGDAIIAVDGQPVAALPLAAARARLKGAPGRMVRVTIDGGAQRVVTLRDLV